MNVVNCVVTGLSLLSVSVAQQKQLQPIDMFRLDYFMTMGAEDPVAWLDGMARPVGGGGAAQAHASARSEPAQESRALRGV